jgi:uncharacterized linocin/CFP29 family protein
MADYQSGPGWSDAQWELIGKAVTEAFDKANVAGKFLPCYGPLPERDDYVREERVASFGNEVSVSDDRTLKLFTLDVKVPLSREQVRDESLASALLAFRRAAVLLSQVEDYLVFNGFDSVDNDEAKERSTERRQAAKAAGAPLSYAPDAEGRAELAADVVTSSPQSLPGLLSAKNAAAPAGARRAGRAVTDERERGESLIRAVSNAIGVLEDRAHPGPFACILGSKRFDDAHTPREKSMVLPADRIKPLLRGPLLRSGQMDDEAGILVSLSGLDIDLVVATSPRVQFLQVREDAKYLFRVYEKFTMRIKDEGAVVPLDLEGVGQAGPRRRKQAASAARRAPATRPAPAAARRATKTSRKRPRPQQ